MTRGIAGTRYSTTRSGYGSSSWSRPSPSQSSASGGTWARPTWSDDAVSAHRGTTDAPSYRRSASDLSGYSSEASNASRYLDAASSAPSIATTPPSPAAPQPGPEAPKPRHWASWQDWQGSGGASLPEGSSFDSLPHGSVAAEVDGTLYSYYRGEFFVKQPQGGKQVYVNVRPPVGAVIRELPAGCGRMGVGGTFYYICGSIWYLPWDDGTFVVVDGPVR
jgi:hypothetical protein